MNKFVLTLLVVLGTIVLSAPNGAQALSCAEMPTAEEAYERYDGIVLAKVERIERERSGGSAEHTGEHHRVALTVERSFKGVEEPSIAVRENITWGALNGPSEIGETYLFFLKQMGEGWEHPLCAPTMPASTAEGAISALADKELPIRRPAVEPLERIAEGAAPGNPPGSTEGAERDPVFAVFGGLVVVLIAVALRGRRA